MAFHIRMPYNLRNVCALCRNVSLCMCLSTVHHYSFVGFISLRYFFSINCFVPFCEAKSEWENIDSEKIVWRANFMHLFWFGMQRKTHTFIWNGNRRLKLFFRVTVAPELKQYQSQPVHFVCHLKDSLEKLKSNGTFAKRGIFANANSEFAPSHITVFAM